MKSKDYQEKEKFKWKHQVKKSVLGEVSFVDNEILWLMAIIYKHNNEKKHLEEESENIVFITPSNLIADIFRSVLISPKQQRKLMQDLNKMYQRGFFEVVQTRTTKIPTKLKWSETIAIDVTNLIRLQDSGESFVCFEDEDLLLITSNERIKLSQTPSLLSVYFNIVSYFNMNDILYVDNNDFDLDYYNTKQDRPHIDCWASLNTLMHKRYSGSDYEENGWITKPTLVKYIQMLSDLELIAIVKPNEKYTKGEHFANHYCFPRHKDLVQKLVDRETYQRMYCRKHGNTTL